MRDEMALIRRCRSFVLQTQGQWTAAARERLDQMLERRGVSGSVDAALEAASAERTSDAVYVCVGSSCSKTPLSASVSGLPIRETACLGACQQAPYKFTKSYGGGFVSGLPILRTLGTGKPTILL